MLISNGWHLLCSIYICQTELLRINLIRKVNCESQDIHLKGVWVNAGLC